MVGMPTKKYDDILSHFDTTVSNGEIDGQTPADGNYRAYG